MSFRVPLALLAASSCLFALPPASAQHLYLDTNGDGVHTTADLLNPGVDTVDVWLRTDRNADGTAALCASDDGTMTLRSYEIVLRVSDGTVGWGSFENRVPGFATALGESSDSTGYRNGFSGPELPPGSYRLATIQVTAGSGTPSLEIVPAASFGSECSGAAFDHIIRLGSDFQDAEGAPWADLPGGAVDLWQPRNMILAEGEQDQQQIIGTDQDNLPLIFTLEPALPFATVITLGIEPFTSVAFDTLTFPPRGTTGSIVLTPGYSDAGSWIAAIRASDGVNEDRKSFLISVANTDRAPVMQQPPDMMAGEGTTAEQSLAAADPEGDPVTFLKVSGPEYMTVTTVDPFYGVGLVTLAPGFFDAGMTSGQVGATDGTLTDTKTFQIMIREVDRPPSLVLPPPPTVTEGDLLRLTVTSSDPDGEVVMITAAGLPSGASFQDGGEGSAELQWAPGFDQAGSYTLAITATGMAGGSTTSPLPVTVLDRDAPIALAQPRDMKVVAGTTAEQTLRAMDQSGDPLLFARVAGPSYLAVTTTGPAEGLARLTPGSSDVGSANATVSVTDGLLSEERSFAIEVQPTEPASNGTPFAPPFLSAATGMIPHTVALADIDGDGRLDLVTANLGANSIAVLLGHGDGTFDMPMFYATASRPHTVVVKDVDGDGIQDLTVSQIGANSIGFLRGLAGGTFGARTDLPLPGSPVFVGVSDLDGDGIQDLVATDQTNGAVDVLRGQGGGAFAPPVAYPTGSRAHGLGIADLNGDGLPDVVAANTGSYVVSVLLGTGGGLLGPKIDFPTTAAHTVNCADLDADGIPDMAVANFDSGTVTVLLGRGDGAFASLGDLRTGAGAHAALIGDLDQDGRPDLIACNQVANTASFFMGRGDGTFAPRVDFSNGLGAHSAAIGDLDGDGAPDVAVSNINSHTVTIFLNRHPRPTVWPARAFAADRSRAIPLGGPGRLPIEILLEPVGQTYGLADLDPDAFTLLAPGSPSPGIHGFLSSRERRVLDRDGNGIPELLLSFASVDLRRALAGLAPGPHAMEAVIGGSLRTGGRIEAPLTLRVIVTGGAPSVRIAPNPSNPEAVLCFATADAGFARVRVYAASGRYLGTLLEEKALPAGEHRVPVRFRPGLPSGVYFYRVETSGGASSGRFVVAR